MDTERVADAVRAPAQLSLQLRAELREGLKKTYGDRLRGLYIYGSHARGVAERDSDVDVLLVLDRVDNYFAELERTGYLSAALSLKYDVVLSRVLLTEEEWLSGERTFVRNVRADAVPA
jgi:predicted nucleotidyltransferase